MILQRILVSLCLLASSALAQPMLFTVSPQDGDVRRIDPATGATISQVTITTPAGPVVTQGHGLAVDPLNGLVYACVAEGGVNPAPKFLLKVDPLTGSAIDLGNTGEKMAGIAFDSTGQLWGISGDGGTIPESLYKIDKATAQITFIASLGNGGNGESLAFNPFDGTLYHSSGTGPLNDPVIGTILEKVDPVSLAVTVVPLTGFAAPGLTALTRHDSGTLLSADFALNLLKVSTSGAITIVGSVDHVAKGIAWVNGPSFFQGYGVGCPGSGGFVPMLLGSGAPNPGQSTSISVTQALGGAPAVLFVGLGQGTANVIPACALQILPILPTLAISLPIFGVGPGNGFVPLPPVAIPGNASTFDLYLQVLVGDPGAAGGIASSAPLDMHIQ